MSDENQIIVNYGYLGSFLSGTLGIFLTAGSLVFLAKTLSFERKRSYQDNFETKFFSLVNNFLNIKSGISRQDVDEVIKEIRSSDLENAKKIVRNYNYVYGDLLRNLYLILKFVSNHESDDLLDKKFYTNLLRSYLPNELIQILAIHCYILEDEKNQKYEKYKEYLEIFGFLEHISIVNNRREIVVPILYVFHYYDSNAFSQNIWMGSNSIIKEIYKKDTKNECIPYLNFFLGKKILSRDDKSEFCVEYDEKNNCYEFKFYSKIYDDYASFCIQAQLNSMNRLIFDDHISASIELKCNKKLNYLYMRITYSKDFLSIGGDYSQIELNIYMREGDLLMDTSNPTYIKDL
ncbi:putative phage abortive infection protein [Acinetobacter sichuanensis]|nr:putative phage abortive infection protein [Acinetobacter sichuanensis]